MLKKRLEPAGFSDSPKVFTFSEHVAHRPHHRAEEPLHVGFTATRKSGLYVAIAIAACVAGVVLAWFMN